MYQHEEFDNNAAYQMVSSIYHKFLDEENLKELSESETRESAYQKTLHYVETTYGKPK